MNSSSVFPSGTDYQAMVEHTEYGILIHEARSKNILWANPAACRMFGFTLSELRPLKAHHMSAQEQAYRRAIGVSWLQDAVNHGVSRRRWKYRSKDGKNFLTHAVATRVDFADGPVVMVEFRSIDQEVEREAELSRASDYLMRIMDYASAGILLLDDEERIVDTGGKSSEELFGRTRDQLIGRRLDEIATVRHRAATLVPPEPGRPREVRFEVNLEGGTRWLLGNIEVVEHDGIRSTMVTVRDITTRTQMERENQYQQANLQYMARYNAMGDMAMTIAHELGQPLAAAGNYLKGLLARQDGERLTPESLRYGLDQAQRQLGRASDIVASVKRYVQRIETSSGDHDLSAIVAESLYFVRLRAADRGVRVEVESSAEPLLIQGEQILIGQVVINLCMNAIDEAGQPDCPEKRIVVRTFAADGQACCSVTDWGRGMDPQTLERQVAPQVLAPPGEWDSAAAKAFSRKQGGSGIGLVLSQRILERHHGTLGVENNHPRGTVFTLRLPLHEG
ncbi:ATP-binding protein [Granulicoccus phenolivorans]|uniref:ATP-binding protein n=1 Tax=Granulicoccus phenolivorans TaxID=266854 RepID=UPI00040771BC|nr:ATP-binding protein [Granulicoccus phenolivorans]